MDGSVSRADGNSALIKRFYEAFDQGDGAAMAAAYAPDARFEDPVFGALTGLEAGAMCRRRRRHVPHVGRVDAGADARRALQGLKMNEPRVPVLRRCMTRSA